MRKNSGRRKNTSFRAAETARRGAGGTGRVYFDGECAMCSAFARRAGPLFARRGFVFTPLAPENGAPREIRLVTAGGRRLGGARALLYLASRLPGGRWITAPARFSPVSRLLDLAYRWVARRRRRLSALLFPGSGKRKPGKMDPVSHRANRGG